MSYAERVSSAEKPVCWGKEETFDLHDEECEACRFQHSCRAQISEKRRSRTVQYPGGSWNRDRPQYGSRQYGPRDGDHEMASRHEPGLVGEHERPVERFLKDGVAGGLRGMFFEFYQFWTKYRIR